MSTSSANALRLYELALQDGRSASPFVWRIRYALAHKGLPYETVKLGFSEIPTAFGGRFKTVPILEHGDTAMAESWDIAEYLDHAFPERPLVQQSGRTVGGASHGCVVHDRGDAANVQGVRQGRA